MDYRPFYKSKTGALPESLNPDIFVNSACRKATIEDEDYRDAIGRIIKTQNIQLDGTYFIVDIGHAHLPAVAHRLQYFNVDISFMIPGYANPRMSETIAFYSRGNLIQIPGLFNIKTPNAYATLIDCHRNDQNGNNYELDASSLPPMDILKRLGITNIVYLNEGDFEVKIDKFPKDLEKSIEDYRKELKISGFGINLINSINKSRIPVPYIPQDY